MRAVKLLACAGLAILVAAGGCKKKSPAREVSVPIAALAAIPADATVVIGIDVARLGASPLAARAIDQMLLRDPELSDRIERLSRDCGVDVARQVRSVFLALGPIASPDAQPSLLVATGEFSESGLARCLQAGVGAGGASLSVKEVGPRRLYTLNEARRTLYFGFGQADTVIIGPSEAWVLAALSNAPKVETSVALRELLTKVDRKAAIWAAAVMDPKLGAALARITKDKVSAPPQALYGAMDAAEGLRAELTFVMASTGDADALAGFARGELTLLAVAAQAWGLGSLVGKTAMTPDGREIRFRIKLSDPELKQLLGAIDRGRPSGQDAQPVPNAGLVPPSLDFHDAGPTTTP